MTGWFLFAVYLSAVNPPRLRPSLATDEQRGQPMRLALAAATVGGVGLVLVLAADDILDALDITDETWRLASGLVCGLVGARALLRPQLGDGPPSARSALVPIAFPLLLTPQLAALAILFGATESFAPAWGWLAVGVGAGVAAGALRYHRPELWLAGARLFAALLLVLGIALVIAGIRDV